MNVSINKLLYDKTVISAEKKPSRNRGIWCKIARVENVYQKDQHSARKIEYDKGVGHILYRAMMHGQRL